MDLLAKLPEMSDDALSNLRSNAKRLQQSGTPSQRSNAARRCCRRSRRKSAPGAWQR